MIEKNARVRVIATGSEGTVLRVGAPTAVFPYLVRLDGDTLGSMFRAAEVQEIPSPPPEVA